MWIAQIDLENAKSYRRESVVFTEGTNAICGPNGAGKSTLLEAIGFVLFNFLPYTQRNFIREGEKTATITVHLVSDDGRTYQVVRKCGRRSRYYVYDPEIDHNLTKGKEETLAWLYEFMEVEETGGLSALFEDAVGVPQGLLTAAFLDKASNRKNTFNPLLRVDEYEQAWEALRGPRSCLKKWIAEQENLIAGFEAEVKPLPTLREKVAGLQAEIEAGEKRQAVLQVELQDLTQRKQALESIEERLDALKQTVIRTEAEVKTLNARLADAQAAVEWAEQARSVVCKTEAGHQAYLAAQANLAELEKQRQERDHLNDTLQRHVTDLALAQQKVKGLESKLEAIATAETEMETLRPQVESQERLEGELAEARRLADRLADAEQNLHQEQVRLADLETRLSGIQAGLVELAEVEGEIEALQAALEELDGQRDALTAQIAAHQAELDQLKEQTVTLEAVETAVCPVCEGALTPEHRSELLARNQMRQAELEAALDEAISRQDTAEKIRRQKQRALRKMEKQVKKLPRQAEADDLAVQIDAQRKVLAGIEATVAEMAGAPADAERLTADLEALRDPRRDYQRAADTASRREAVEKDLTATMERIAELKGHRDALEGELANYADLDEQIEAGRAAQAAHEPDHQRYLEHTREAEMLGERKESVAALNDERKAAHTECERLVQERDQVAVGYDAAAYAQLVEAFTALSSEMATLSERIRLQRSQVGEGQAGIERLVSVQETLETARVEHAELVEVLALLDCLRQVLRDAGPKVTQALVEVISLQAARLYADIMTGHTAWLRWTEDYEIVLMAGGRERTFKQLSGGEQMAAALAVRLALLREVSAVDVAFFDEPTANLDDHRRDNLAEQILNVKGFSQLFVISHDDTFERDTDNVVRVVKENGVSRVEV
ncbi:MAG: AAA family ATPase [Chloroflexota bacterium]|nr:AAA family ATPase [Chloroflexota bacterium]